MTEQRERVAEAIWQACYGRHRKNRKWPDDILGGSADLFRAYADAAIAAMGEREVPVSEAARVLLESPELESAVRGGVMKTLTDGWTTCDQINAKKIANAALRALADEPTR